MIVAEWKRKLKKSVRNKDIDISLQILSEELAIRDKAKEEYIKLGNTPLIRDSEGNLVKNQALTIIEACNSNVLPYLKELGLTPNNKQEDIKQEEIKEDQQEKQSINDEFNDRFNELLEEVW